MAERYKKNDLKSISQKEIFFDTNILLFIFHSASGSPSKAQAWQSNYSGILHDIIRQKNKLYTNLFVISEFYNRYLRMEASIQNPDESDKDTRSFKKFRDSESGIQTQNEIKSIIKNNLPRMGFTYLDTSFTHDEIIQILDISNSDFIDRVIVETCKRKNLVLFTDDADFRDSDIPIFSLNPIMF